MILLKEFDKGFVTVQMSCDDLCDIHNALYYARQNKEVSKRYELLDLTITNLYEMIHHGFLTNFGRYKNYKYAKDHKEYEGWEEDEESEVSKE